MDKPQINGALEHKAALRSKLATVPKVYSQTLKKLESEGKSRVAAIKAKCLDCVGYEIAVKRIRECECYGCPLWDVRPYQEKESIGS